jgi:hypothetical protein
MIAVRSLTIPLAAIAVALSASGCYTLLKHPRVDTAAYEEIQDNSCTSCHYEDELWYYHHAPRHRVYPGVGAEAWGFYYAVPWWYDSYWHYTPSSDPSTIPLPTRQLRSGTDKGQLEGSAAGHVGRPTDPKSTGTVRYRHTGEDSDKDSQGTGEAKANDDEPKKRDVRPKTTKDKDKKKNSVKGKPAG